MTESNIAQSFSHDPLLNLYMWNVIYAYNSFFFTKISRKIEKFLDEPGSPRHLWFFPITHKETCRI